MTNNTPKYSQFKQRRKIIGANTALYTDIPVVKQLFSEFFIRVYPDGQCYDGLYLAEDIPDRVARAVEMTFGTSFSDNPDAYAVLLDESVRIYSRSKRGLLYGFLALRKLADEQVIAQGIFYEAPVCEVRGAKLYLPGRQGLAYFKEFLDFLADFRMNTVMIEIGGAMEYKRHPEINEGWTEYCKDIAAYSGKSADIQDRRYPWLKNSIHVENGAGSFLTQDEVRELAAYARERYIDIIPEVPSFSHCDYLLIRHPEIRERKDDDYADTYCPSDERSYELLFDVLDEVTDVFQPKMINIGHDEAYSIGVCEVCSKKDPVELYAGDIRRIYDYLTVKGIKTMFWGEKLLNASTEEGPAGGAVKFKHYETGLPLDKPVPAIYPAIGLIPKDCEMLHWYWKLNDGHDEEFHRNGLSITYGNFSPTEFKNWRKRLKRGVRGAICSNWSDVKPENLQRNGMLYNLAFCDRLFWEDDYSEDMRYLFDRQAFENLYYYHYGNYKHGFRIVHSTDYYKEYRLFFDGNFIIDSEYDMGYYLVTYSDQTQCRLPVRYGYNISCENPDLCASGGSLAEIAFTARPLTVSDGGLKKVRYETICKNPYPDKTVQSVAYIKNDALNADVALFSFEVFYTGER